MSEKLSDASKLRIFLFLSHVHNRNRQYCVTSGQSPICRIRLSEEIGNWNADKREERVAVMSNVIEDETLT